MQYIESIRKDTNTLHEILEDLKYIRQQEKEFLEQLESTPSSPDFGITRKTSLFTTPVSRTNSLFSKEAEKPWSMRKNIE